jgi:hypothetical protein
MLSLFGENNIQAGFGAWFIIFGTHFNVVSSGLIVKSFQKTIH